VANSDIGNLGRLLQEAFQGIGGLKAFLQAVVQRVMEAEAQEHVGAAPHERSEQRRGHRNGTKPRMLNTRVGELELEVPQVRGCEPYHPSLFNKWQRSERALLATCAEMYFQGVSTRNVRRVLEAMCQGEVSAMTVSRVASELDEKLSEFRGRRLDHASWPYLMIDARYEKVRVEGRVVSQAVLVVVGFTDQGRREVLHWSVGDSESEPCWSEVFKGLKDRGLTGVKLAISDAHQGIRRALSRHFQGVAWQRCRVHFKREMGRKVSYKVVKELMSDLAAVYAAWNRGECLRRGQEMAGKWEGRYPAVSAMLNEGLEDTLSVLSLPENHRRKLASTNLLENIMKRLKKRTRVVGIFPNRASCDRLIGSQLLELHETWQVEETSYLNMEQNARLECVN
jgi:transposase-like protein